MSVADGNEWEQQYRKSIEAERERLEREEDVISGRDRAEGSNLRIRSQVGTARWLVLLGFGSVALVSTRTTIGVVAGVMLGSAVLVAVISFVVSTMRQGG